MFSSENLEMILEKPRPQISHQHVGRHFTAFNGERFIPNDELRQRYPEDEPEAERLQRLEKFNYMH